MLIIIHFDPTLSNSSLCRLRFYDPDELDEKKHPLGELNFDSCCDTVKFRLTRRVTHKTLIEK